VHPGQPTDSPQSRLTDFSRSSQDTLLRDISTRNAAFFEDEAKKLDAWADDQITASEKALKDIKKRIRELRNEATKATDLAEQARIQGEISEQERRQRRMRQDIFDIEDRILAERDRLLNAIRGKLQQSVSSHPLFTVRWSLDGSQRGHSEKSVHVLSA